MNRVRRWLIRSLVRRQRREDGARDISPALQNAMMRQHRPEFRRTLNLGFIVKWRGEVRPISRPYEIEITFRPRRRCVSVRLLKPALILKRPGAERITHVFPNRLRPERSNLCLYDTRDGEWSPIRAIAETTIPWAV